ncbi:hypothetical protein [Streptomyces sp. CMB-StM0423]|uniref:hypothetical protein n=1 Tax=Streptomyces sp. CMB-StM0423 TaxID=2059884 RepID=UPI000C710969|nr:hypothetical protein [Streptomyces sp. CMB-StM0423]AUH39105.1 hypothetical protein CXR04_01520 [Streptomyces sp. CMB-StM0423]
MVKAADAPHLLLDEVCRLLAAAGFDVTAGGGEGAAGLHVRRDVDAVVVRWEPGAALDPAGRGHSEPDGIRAALRYALLATLTQAGHAVHVDHDSDDVHVRGPAPTERAEVIRDVGE